MSLLALVNQMLPRLDPRSPDEVAKDVDDEFAFHLAAVEAELIEAGAAPDKAKREAAERFGDTDKYKRQCARIAMEERIMLQRINAVLMVIVLLAVIGVSVQMYLTQRYNSLALADITAQLATMKVIQDQDVGAANQRPAPSDEDALINASRPGMMISVRGNVVNPGVYTIHEPELTINELISMSGGIDTNVLTEAGQGAQISIAVDRPVGNSRIAKVFRREISHLADLSDDDLRFRSGDVLFVTILPRDWSPPAPEGPSAAQPGDETHPFVYVTGLVRRPGVYSLPTDGTLTVERLLAASGDITVSPAHIALIRVVDGKSTSLLDQTVDDISSLVGAEVGLRGGDMVRVSEPVPAPDRPVVFRGERPNDDSGQ